MSRKVAVLGSLNIDTTMNVHAHPAPGETVLGDGVRLLPGGKGANQAVAAARAGAEVTLIGKVGDDGLGARYLHGLGERGVDTSAVRIAEEEPTGQAFIAVDANAENTIIVVPGANASAELDEAAIAGADVLALLLELPIPLVCKAVRYAAARGVRVVLNASPVSELPTDVLELADPVIVNQHELAALPDGLPSVCVTLGAEGARWGTASARPPKVTPIDTTGAGDCFAGTLAAALASGASNADSLASAVKASAEATTWQGAQGWQL